MAAGLISTYGSPGAMGPGGSAYAFAKQTLVQYVNSMPIPYVQPIDVSHAITCLASDESRYVTGTQLRVDAGAVNKAGK
ncbi:SDR family oxidoreductase [Streptomyces sp. NPDC052101]|uniref:SDR family oxidoreductase n=1 Tax=Streptomyces sp. NPDC052101 TaxID=3155763 RepID=UPI00341F1E4D